MSTLWKHYAWICLIAGLIFFVNLGGPKLWDRDEPRNAGCAVEMAERGNWIVPMFNDELRIHKPVLLYWFMMTAYAVFDDGEFAARFWSAVFGLGTVLATYHIGRRLFTAQIGFWAAVILSSCMMFPVAARAATPDSVLTFFVTLATLVFVYGAFPRRDRGVSRSPSALAASANSYFPTAWPVVTLMYALMGVAILAKGPVGLVLPTAVIGMFLLIVRLPAFTGATNDPQQDAFVGFLRRLLRPFAPRHFLAVCWSMRPLTALAASLAVALPWYLWVGYRTDGEWLRGFFLVHHLQRATQPMEGHDGPIFYYLIAIVASFFPWSLLLIPTIEQTTTHVRRQRPSRAPYVFIACWAAVYLAAFSLARTKLPNYVTPALPAFALMAACFVEPWRRRGHDAPQYWFRFAFSALMAIGVAIGLGIAVAGFWLLPGDQWLGAIGLIPLVGGLVGRRFLGQCQPRKAFAAFAATAVVFACTLFGFTATRVARHQHFDELLSAIHARSAHPQIVAYGCLEPSWVYYGRRPIRLIADETPEEAASFVGESPDHFLITSDKDWKTVESLFPQGTTPLASVPYFMRQEQLLLIGHREQLETAESSAGDMEPGDYFQRPRVRLSRSAQ